MMTLAVILVGWQGSPPAIPQRFSAPLSTQLSKFPNTSDYALRAQIP
ncbi:hypothetical protein GFS31_00070 [Leptolyngbya sp. BL0902]|nr:hypothetical protein GFS31_00070 [Leptolyngbya sp. BL0902]